MESESSLLSCFKHRKFSMTFNWKTKSSHNINNHIRWPETFPFKHLCMIFMYDAKFVGAMNQLKIVYNSNLLAGNKLLYNVKGCVYRWGHTIVNGLEKCVFESFVCIDTMQWNKFIIPQKHQINSYKSYPITLQRSRNILQ